MVVMSRWVASFRSGRLGLGLAVLITASGLALLTAAWWLRPASTPVAIDPGLEQSADSPTQAEYAAAPVDPAALRIKAWHFVDGFTHELAQFDTVFWEPRDTTSLRGYLSNDSSLAGTRVLEIGTGTGLVALWCAQLGAAQVIATDINPQAVANAGYNAELLGLADRIEVRWVPADNPTPFAVVAEHERFDVIISNPPWEDAPIEEIAAAALYDPNFQLLTGILTESPRYLKPNGKLLLAYGALTAIERILATAPQLGWQVKVCDERQLESLPEVFVPGVLLELTR